MGEWREYKISDIADVIGGGTPKTSVAEYWNGDIPWLSVVDFNTGKKYVSKTEKTITNLGLKKSSTKLLQTNDIIISARGTVGALAMLDKPMAFNQSCYGMRAKEEITTSDYLFYLLKNTVRQLQQASYGAVFDTITRNTFDETNISLPPLKEQKAIAEVLSSLDDKIDLLHRQNKTLEELAQTIFREWFIEGADEGWEEKPLSYFGNIVCGKTPSKKNIEYYNGNIPFIKIPDMHGNTFIFNTTDTLTEKGSNSQKNKLLPPKSICISCIATVGLVSMNIIESQTNQQINSIIPKQDNYRYFLYLYMKSSYDLLHAMASGGTATLNLNTGDFKKMGILKPNEDILNNFHNLVEPQFNKIFANQQQIKTLENLRDTLLPKLMSGEVRVKLG
jgi:type I restriction enzyme S subunit